MNSRLRAIAYWSSAPLLMLALYWPGLLAWFQKDDFAWLGLRGLVHNPRDLAWALFAPLAQGTIRTLSERAVNLSFVSLFGFRALPFRCLAFVTCIAAISMLAAVATKISGSRAVGFCSAIFWTLNSAIAIPLAWTAVYYELAWPFWLLTMFWLLLRYDETGERRFFIAQCAMFVLGFFVLEMNVVYPAIAAAYALATGKRALLIKVIPLFAISLLYTAIHFYFAPLPSSGPYKMHWDLGVISTLIQYWGWALGPGLGRLIGIVSTAIRSTLVWTLTAGLFAFLIRAKRDAASTRAWFFPAWFLITLCPLLPLHDHIDMEYLTAPTLGLAMWAGWATVAAWRAEYDRENRGSFAIRDLRRRHDSYRSSLRKKHLRRQPPNQDIRAERGAIGARVFGKDGVSARCEYRAIRQRDSRSRISFVRTRRPAPCSRESKRARAAVELCRLRCFLCRSCRHDPHAARQSCRGPRRIQRNRARCHRRVLGIAQTRSSLTIS